MSKNLIIVESPTKARTLSRFLGSEYSIEATTPHNLTTRLFGTIRTRLVERFGGVGRFNI